MRHPEPRSPSPLLAGPVRTDGMALGFAFAVTAAMRRSKPLHPVGVVAKGRHGREAGTWPFRLTSAGCPRRARLPGPRIARHRQRPRACGHRGFRHPHPSVRPRRRHLHRHHTDTTDILFAGTGVGPLGRFLLTVRPPGRHATQTTLLPVRSAGRALQLRLESPRPATQPWPATYSSRGRTGVAGGDPSARSPSPGTASSTPLNASTPLLTPPGTRAYPVLA